MKAVRYLVILAILAIFVLAGGVSGAGLNGYPVSWAQHEFLVCDSSGQLVFGHAVPLNETWTLTSMHAKNNTGATHEINVAIYSAAIDEWVCLEGKVNTGAHEGVAWSGAIEMSPYDQLGWWFRGATEGDVLQVDATFTRKGEGIVRGLELPINKVPYVVPK